MQLSITSLNKGTTSKLKVADHAFGAEFKEGLVHQVVTAHLSAARAGTKGQKTRSDVSGGGAKPWRQKGTGRARAGTSRGPLWRGGGVTFAAKNRDFSQKVNRKMYRGAMASILSELVRLERLTIVDDLKLKEPKTKPFALVLKKMKLEKVLIVTDEENTNLFLAARNIPNVKVVIAKSLSPVDLVGYENVLMTSAAVKQIEERLA